MKLTALIAASALACCSAQSCSNSGTSWSLSAGSSQTIASCTCPDGACAGIQQTAYAELIGVPSMTLYATYGDYCNDSPGDGNFAYVGIVSGSGGSLTIVPTPCDGSPCCLVAQCNDSWLPCPYTWSWKTGPADFNATTSLRGSQSRKQ
jgi:hypothetical protein